MTITVFFQSVGKKTEVEKGVSALEAARRAGAGLSAVCGGRAECGSCVIKLPAQSPVNPPTSTEKEILGSQKLSRGFRLACQTELLGSVVIDMPTESPATLQRRRTEGEEERVVFNPLLKIHDISIKKTNLSAPEDDWQKVLATLTRLKIPRPKIFSINAVRNLSPILRENDWKARLITRKNTLIAVFAPRTPALGMAADLGTTKIAGYLVNMENGETMAQAGTDNPQTPFGEDVMTRIACVMGSEDGGRAPRESIIDSLNSMAEELCQKAGGIPVEKSAEQVLKPSRISEFVIVGNTAMHHIFLGLSVRQLGLAPYIPLLSQSLDVSAAELKLNAAPGAMVHLPPNIAGFIGSDHVSMLLASGVGREKKNVLYMDIGTNTEITLKVGDRLISCSAASGPAFEGARIKDGARAGEGAIERVKFENDAVRYQTIGNCKPVGICGSGIVDAVAEMIAAGLVSSSGAFNPGRSLARKGEKGLEVVIAPAAETKSRQDIVITRKDVGETQLAKGAIRAGIELLLKKAGISLAQIEKLILAGSFGTFLNIDSAKAIGLIPPLKNAQIIQVGNAAGIGARQVLISAEKRSEAGAIRERIEYLELANHPEFSKEFTKAISFGE